MQESNNMKITHIKGIHFSLPFSIKCSSKQTIEWTVDFTDATYDVGMPDQYDWNKLCGIKWNYFQPRKDALMVGWRYINNRYELCLYVHRNSSFNPPSEPLVVTDKLAKITLSLDEVQKTATLTIVGNDLDSKKSQTIDWDLFDKYWFINSWFGGNKVPNRTVKFNLDQK